MTHRFSPRATALLLTGALLAAPLAALAQPATPASASAPAARRDAFVEQRIATLRTQLKITPDEQKSFDDFATTMRQNATQMNGAVEKAAALPSSATALERMQAYSDVAQTHAQNMQQLTASFTTFYGMLTPQQKKVVDTSFAQQQARRNAKS